MSQSTVSSSIPVPLVPLRHGDLSAMLRIMQPLNSTLADPVVQRRRLLADLCRLVGQSVGACDKSEVSSAPDANFASDLSLPPLPPQLQATLAQLLSGQSEKEVATTLKISRHTVHCHVKSLYRRFSVCSRAELLAHHLHR